MYSLPISNIADRIDELSVQPPSTIHHSPFTMKLATYLVGLGAVTSALLGNLTPVRAQIAGGNDNGSGREAIVAPLPGNRQSAYIAQSQTAVDRFSQSLTASSIGDAATFDVINGGAPAPLVAVLLPTGMATDGTTAKAAQNLASTLQGMRSGDGKIDASKLNRSVGAFNQYVTALVGELGPDAAVATAPVGQKAVQGLLSQLVRVANQAAPK
ncbi:hypothetical protein [Chamaesiphon sp.]|uniref:hypothetical protein n=1 Tax=Chamaesiphon sp. TaxID=2814140 RepID=UPI003593A9C1